MPYVVMLHSVYSGSTGSDRGRENQSEGLCELYEGVIHTVVIVDELDRSVVRFGVHDESGGDLAGGSERVCSLKVRSRLGTGIGCRDMSR